MNPSPILSMGKESIHPGRVLRGRPGSAEAPFCGLANLWTASQTSSSNHSPMGIFSRIRRREKKEKIPAHTNSCSRLLKLPAEAVYHKYRKNAHLKLIFLPISREAVNHCYRRPFSKTGRAWFFSQRSAFNPRTWMPHPKMPEGVPRETDLFLSSSITPQNRTKPNLTQTTLSPSGRD